MKPIPIAPGIDYYPRFIAEPEEAFAQVMGEVDFAQRSRRMYGRTFAIPRLEAWHGSRGYTFGGSTLPARELPPSLLSIRIALECFLSGVDFDGCLANLYRDGRDTVGWHSDDEPEMADPIIASVSLGAARDFCFRRNIPTPVIASAMLPNKLKISLAPGSLLVMGRGVQSEWEHSLPRRTRVTEPRINLTYRGQPT